MQQLFFVELIPVKCGFATVSPQIASHPQWFPVNQLKLTLTR